MPSQMLDMKPGICIEIDGRVIVDSRGSGDLDGKDSVGAPNKSRDRP